MTTLIVGIAGGTGSGKTTIARKIMSALPDGSAEIIVVSNEDTMDNVASPTVQVYGDAQDRWIQARRVWNQHAYTITNVLEDGRIPQNPTPSWKAFNTFRTNAQIENGEVCVPPAG